MLLAAGLGLAKNVDGNLNPASSITGSKGWRSRLRTEPLAVKKADISVKKLDPKSWHLLEDFEGTFPPAGWTTHDISGKDEVWQKSDWDYYNGSYSAFVNYDCSEWAEDWLITPPVTIQAHDSISFWFNCYDYSYIDDTYLKISTTDNQLASFTTTLLHLWDDGYETGNYPIHWTRYAVDLTPYAGQTVYLAFQHTDDCGDGIFIDDVSVGHGSAPTSHDICVNSIDLPTIVIAPAVPFAPTATIQNAGLNPESDFKIFFQINDSLGAEVYLDSAAITSPDSISPDSIRQFAFGNFTPDAFTKYTAIVWTTLTDDYSWDDTLAKPFRTWDLDVATKAIINPSGSEIPDPDITPKVVFHNAALQTADFTANFEATFGGTLMYDQQVNIIGLAGGADTTVEFPAWPGIRLEGTYQIKAFTEMAHDLDATNDTVIVSLTSGYNIWVSKTPLPVYQYCHAVAPWNGRIYLFGGAPDGDFCNTIQYYDTLTGLWNTAATTMPTNLFGASAITLGDRIFIIGGCEVWATPLNTVYCYWPDGDSLTTKASLPTATMEMAAGLWRDSLIYIMGGGNWATPQISTVQIYDIVNNSWSTGTTMPGAVGTNGGGVCGDTIVSVGGYLTNACYYGVIDTTNPTSITWSTGTAYPAGNLSRLSTAVRDHKIYTVAGFNGSDATANAYYYSPADDSWTQLPDRITATIGAGQAAMVGDWMYVIAGESSGDNQALFLGTSDKAQPVITATDPADGATDIDVAAPVTVTFSKSMDTTSVTYSCIPDPGNLAAVWNYDYTIMTVSHDSFAYSTNYSFMVTAGQSLDGYNLKVGSVPDSFSFGTVVSGVSGQPVMAGVPYFLASAAPNPMGNGQTTIAFGLPRSSQVRIDIYNVAGQHIKTLVNGNMNAGYHSITWNGRNEAGKKVANGVYMYRMNSGNFQATKKLLILK
jgi:hypothetical protein